MDKNFPGEKHPNGVITMKDGNSLPIPRQAPSLVFPEPGHKNTSPATTRPGVKQSLTPWHRETSLMLASCLRLFLREKFLVWLEGASILGTGRGAVVASEKPLSWSQEVCFYVQFYSTGGRK